MGHLGYVAQDLRAGSFVVGTRVGVIGVLVGEEPIRVFGCEGLSPNDRPVRTFLARSKNHFGAKHLEHLAALHRNAGRHHDLDRIALDSCDRSESDPRISRRRFENRLTWQ